MDQWKYELSKAVFEWMAYAHVQTHIGEKHFPSQPEKDINLLAPRSEGWHKAAEITTSFFSGNGQCLVLCGSADWDLPEYQQVRQVREIAGELLCNIRDALKEAKAELPNEHNYTANFHSARGAMDCTINAISSIIREYGCNHIFGEMQYTPWEDGPPDPYVTCTKCNDTCGACEECDAPMTDCYCVPVEYYTPSAVV